jgi:hypothetical protein
MKAKIEIQMDNAAFEDNGPASELAHILRDLAKHIENGDTERALMDSNGNRVGRFEVTADGKPSEEVRDLCGVFCQIENILSAVLGARVLDSTMRPFHEVKKARDMARAEALKGRL